MRSLLHPHNNDNTTILTQCKAQQQRQTMRSLLHQHNNNNTPILTQCKAQQQRQTMQSLLHPHNNDNTTNTYTMQSATTTPNDAVSVASTQQRQHNQYLHNAK